MDYETKVLKEAEEINNWNHMFDYHEGRGYTHKSSVLSSQARTEGNQLYKQKNHDDKVHQSILSLYTKSIALAAENSEEQALAYSNRSALLMHLQKNKECLADINRACKITQSSGLKKKLLLRKEKCLELIKKDAENDEVENLNRLRQPNRPCPQDAASFAPMLKEAFSELFPTEEALRDSLDLPRAGTYDDILEKFSKLKLPKIMSPNKIISNFADSISVEYSEKFGRHVFASKNIRPGEILVVEKGFVFPALSKIYLVCSHCLNFTWNGIPCPTCVFAVYCSEKCKVKAWQEYHDIECSILPPLFSEAFINPSNPDMSHEFSSIRLFIMFVKSEGLQNILDQAKSIDTAENSHISGFLTNGKFDNTKFRSYYNLMNHEEDLKKIGNIDFGSSSTFLLSKYTTILNDYKESKDLKNMEILVLIKKLIIKLKTTIDNNSHAFQDISCECKNSQYCKDKCPKNLGLIVAPGSSLFNHSCFPNASKIFCKGGKVLVFSTRPIKKNEQLFISYGTDLNAPRIDRQIYLRDFYHFNCDCEPCKFHWLEEIVSKKKKEVDWGLMSKVFKEYFDHVAKLKAKKIDYLSLATSIKMIELSFKYHDNNYKAYQFCNEQIDYISKYIHRLYGIEVKIPKKC